MFPKKSRLARAAFPAALSGAKRLSSPHLSVSIPRTGTGYAVIVSKKTARLSTTRHRIKRRVLSALRSLSHLPPVLVVYPKASTLELRYKEIQAELSALLSKTSH